MLLSYCRANNRHFVLNIHSAIEVISTLFTRRSISNKCIIQHYHHHQRSIYSNIDLSPLSVKLQHEIAAILTVFSGKRRVSSSRNTDNSKSNNLNMDNYQQYQDTKKDDDIVYAFPPYPIPSLPVMDPSKTTHTSSTTKVLFPIHRVYCVGKNYTDHVIEMGGNIERDTPVFFTKPTYHGVIYAGDRPETEQERSVSPTPSSCPSDEDEEKVEGSNSPATEENTTPSTPPTKTTYIEYPLNTNNLHYEIELVVAIGKEQHTECIDPTDVPSYIYGYTIGIDLTRRDLQTTMKENKSPWDIAKYFDNSAPMSSITAGISLEEIENTTISLSVNGNMKQTSPIKHMIWNISEIIAELSKSFLLRPGDLIMTGTPAGVGPVEIGDHIIGQIDHNMIENIDITIIDNNDKEKTETASHRFSI